MFKQLTLYVTLAALPLCAQNFAEITGTVSDPTGAAMSGASITVTSAATNQVRSTTSNTSGIYSVPYLVPGLYDVRLESPGFKVETRKAVELQVGATARIDFTMEIGEVTQQVEVTGGAPLLATENVTLGTVIENRRIVDLPLNGRNYLQLVTLSTNVTTEGGAGGGSGLQGGARAQASYSIAGQRLEFNHYTLDGVENTDPNFNSYIIQPSVDFIQEFKVQTGVYSAEFGRATSQIGATTKSGTNEYHGTAYEFIRNSAVDARQWQQTGAKNPFRRNQYGFTLGGPVNIPKVFDGRDRLFFISNFEQLRDRTTTRLLASVATDRMRAGDFSLDGPNATIFDPLTRTYNASGLAVSALPFAGNIVPQSRLNPVSLKLLEFYPNPTVPGDTILNNYSRNALTPNDSDQFNQRIDFNQSSKASWFARYSWGDDLQTTAAVFPNDNATTETRVRQGVIANTRIFGPRTVNDIRFGWNEFDNDKVGALANKRDVAKELNIPGFSAIAPIAFGVPSIGLGQGLNSFGGNDPWITRNDTFQLVDSISVVRGRHSIRFGGEIRRDRYNQSGNQKATGEFDFNNQATFNPAARTTSGYYFASYMIGEMYASARTLAVANTMLRTTSYAGFIQDDWKITPKLTLNAGVRYENTRPWKDKYRGIMNALLFDPGVGPNGLLPPSQTKVPIFVRPGPGDFYQGLNFHFADGIVTQVSDTLLGSPALVYPDNNNFGPRIGLAYSPTARWTFRTGFGTFFTQDSGNPVFDMGRNQAGRDAFTTDVERPNQNFSDPFKFERQSYICTGYSGTCLGAPTFLGNIPGNRTPYVFQWLFNIQRQLTDNIVIEAGYQGNEGHKLERLRIYNQPVLRTGPTDARSITDRRPWPIGYGRLQEVDGGENSNYHALNVKVTQRFNKGLSYMIGYTWSKAIDDGSAIRTNTGDQLWPSNSYDFTSMHGLSQFDVPRRFVVSSLYELPVGAGKPFLNRTGFADKIVGGWQLSGILTLADGAAITPGAIGDSANLDLSSGPNRANATGISPIPDNRSASNFWNIKSLDPFSPTLSYTIGNLGRGTFFSPGTRNLDLSMTKTVRLHERHSLEFRFDAFNSFNHPNWNTPPTDARSPTTFGVVSSARTMRQLQGALKYIF